MMMMTFSQSTLLVRRISEIMNENTQLLMNPTLNPYNSPVALELGGGDGGGGGGGDGGDVFCTGS
jgi:hypothetical protein